LKNLIPKFWENVRISKELNTNMMTDQKKISAIFAMKISDRMQFIEFVQKLSLPDNEKTILNKEEWIN